MSGECCVAWTPGNLSLLLGSKADITTLLDCERRLHEHLRAAADAAPPPSLLAGVFVRFKFENAYHLRQVEHAAVAADGKPALAIVHPTAPAPPLLLIPLASVSGTNPLQGRLRETAGVDELARLQACMAARAVRLPVQEAARVAWRKLAALRWWSLHAAEADEAEAAGLAGLLRELQDGEGIASMRQQFQAAEQDPQQAREPAAAEAARLPQAEAGRAGFTLRLAGRAPEGGQVQPQQDARQQRLQADEQQHDGGPWEAGEPAGRVEHRRPATVQRLPPPRPARSPARSTGGGRKRRRSPERDRAPLPGGGTCTVLLPGCAGLPAALRLLCAAVHRAVPDAERGAPAKRAALSGLLRRGLLPFGKDDGLFRQLPVHLEAAAEEMERACDDHEVRLQYRAFLDGAASTANLLADVADRRLLELAPDGDVALLRVDHLAAEYGGPLSSGKSPPGLLGAREQRGGRAAGQSAAVDTRAVRRRSSSPARPPRRARSPPSPSRSRSGSRSRTRSPPRRRGGGGGGGAGRGRGDELGRVVWPVLVRHISGKEEWMLAGREVFVSLPGNTQPGELRARAESEGFTVVKALVMAGDSRGDRGCLTLPSAREAARLIETLQGKQLRGYRMFCRPFNSEVKSLAASHPREVAEARAQLKALAATAARRQGAAAADAARPERPRSPGRQLAPQRRRSASPGSPPQRHRRSSSPGSSRQRHRRSASPGSPPPPVGSVAARALAARAAAGRATPDLAASPRPSRGRRRRRSRSPAGAPRHGARSRSGSRGRAVRVGGASPSVAQPFWDPVCQLEGQCVRRLGARGPMRLEDLLAAVDWAPQLGQASTANLAAFLDRRPHLFALDASDISARAAALPHAEAFLRYKRALLQYLADRPPRVPFGRVERGVPRPEELPPSFHLQDLRSFVRQYFADETWILLGPRRYLEPDLASEGTLELRPFALQRGASDDGAPAFPPICRRFKGTAASCADGWRCAMSHAMPRVFL